MSLRDFTRAYVEAALWSSTDDEGNPLDQRRAPIGDETQRQMELDSAGFYERAEGAWQGITDARAGFLFWLNRNGHGSGFWDEDGLPKAARASLSDYAKSYGSFDLYIGDDGQIHGSPLSNEANSPVMAGLRGPRGSQITSTNLFALRDMVRRYGPDAIPARVEQVDFPHLQRCYKAGLIAPHPGNQTLYLTEAGRQALETGEGPRF